MEKTNKNDNKNHSKKLEHKINHKEESVNNNNHNKSNNDKRNNNPNNKFLLITILLLIAINLVISVGVLLNNSTQGQNYDNKINNMNSKINAIDNFFRTNLQGYVPNGNSDNTNSAPTPSNKNQNTNTNKVKVSADDDPWIGNKNAKVTVIEFSDYECPFCRKYFVETYPQVKKDFIDTGKIKYVFRDFPLSFHRGAPIAAVAANCVKEQQGNEGYFKFHDIAFSEQAKLGQNTIDFGKEDVLNWVKKVNNIDQEKFNTCLNDPKQKAEVDADIQAGIDAGVSGTPTFFINGQKIVGAQPYSVIKAAIEKALNK